MKMRWEGQVLYATEYDAERFYRDAKLSSITEGTSEIQHVIIAKELGI